MCVPESFHENGRVCLEMFLRVWADVSLISVDFQGQATRQRASYWAHSRDQFPGHFSKLAGRGRIVKLAGRHIGFTGQIVSQLIVRDSVSLSETTCRFDLSRESVDITTYRARTSDDP